MDQRSSNLLDEALGLDQTIEPWPLRRRLVAIEDRVEISGSFVLHHLLKRSLSPNSSNVSIFIAFSQPYSHYDRVLRKLGCNLETQRDNYRFFFFDMLMLQCPGGDEGITPEGGLIALYGKIHKTILALPEISRKNVFIIIDDLSLMEVAANGSSDYVLDFLHYCRTLTSEWAYLFVTDRVPCRHFDKGRAFGYWFSNGCARTVDGFEQGYELWARELKEQDE